MDILATSTNSFILPGDPVALNIVVMANNMMGLVLDIAVDTEAAPGFCRNRSNNWHGSG